MTSTAQTPQQTERQDTRWRWLAAIGLTATLIVLGGTAAAYPLNPIQFSDVVNGRTSS
jgi:hypothetical protein